MRADDLTKRQSNPGDFFSPDLLDKERPVSHFQDILFLPWFINAEQHKHIEDCLRLCHTYAEMPVVRSNGSQDIARQSSFLAQRETDHSKSIKHGYLRTLFIGVAAILLTILSISAMMFAFAFPITNTYTSSSSQNSHFLPKVSLPLKKTSSHNATAKLTSSRHQQSDISTTTSCSILHIVLNGETLSSIASNYGIDWFLLASFNKLSTPNQLMIGQSVCIPAGITPSRNTSSLLTPSSSAIPTAGQSNVFPSGQCTWWTNERYYQFHGIYVPWSTSADAWQWTARATDFGWHISNTPQVGDIIDLQPDVQGHQIWAM